MRKKLNKHNLLSDLSKISEGSDSQASTITSNQQSDQEITESLKSSRINIDPLDLRYCLVFENSNFLNPTVKYYFQSCMIILPLKRIIRINVLYSRLVH